MSIFDYKKSNQSENGEDGILNYIFDKLNIKLVTYLDIGSKGGVYNSNTFMLLEKSILEILTIINNIKALQKESLK